MSAETVPYLLPWLTTLLFGVLWIRSVRRESRADGAREEAESVMRYYRKFHLEACDQRDRAAETLRLIRLTAGGKQ